MMPSLSRYFTIAGGGLLGLLIALDAIMGRGGPGPSLVAANGPRPLMVKHDPQVLPGRLRSEEIASNLAPKEEQPLSVIEVSADLSLPTVELTVSPSTNVAPNLPVSNVEAAENAKVALVNAKSEQARKKRLPRDERIRAQQEARSRWQDQLYYDTARSNIDPFTPRRAAAQPINKLAREN